MAAKPQPVTTNRQRWLYAFANLGPQIMQQSLGTYLLFFYADVKRLPAQWVGTALVLYAIYNAVNNPILGYVSDRTKTRWGRRIPYILFGTIPMVIAFALVWLAPFDGQMQPVTLLIYFAVMLVITDGLYTAVCTIGYYTMLADMFPTFEERSDVSVRMNVFLLAGLILGLVLPPLIYSADFWQGINLAFLPDTVAENLGWFGMGIIFAVVVAASLFIGVTGMKERPQDPNHTSQPMLTEILSAARNSNFRSVAASQALRFFITYTLTAGIPFYVAYTLGAPDESASLILGVAIVTAAPALYGWYRLAHRIGPRATIMASFMWMAASVVPLGFTRTVIATAIAAVPLGVGLAGLIFMGDLILADVIDEDELNTGRRREGVYYGFIGLITTASSALTALLFTWVSARFGYDTSLLVQPESVGMGFRFFMVVPGFIAAALAIFSLLPYSLHGERLQEVKSEIAERQLAMQEGGSAG